MTNRPVDDMTECLSVAASQHGAHFPTTSLPQGKKLDFGDWNVFEGAGGRCAPCPQDRRRRCEVPRDMPFHLHTLTQGNGV
jgi:hypothetical protein